jgi:hypothetical protein
MPMPDFTSTREALVHAIGEIVANAAPERQAKVAEALEAFAKIRGRERYERLIEHQPLFGQLIGEIEECSDARLFLHPGAAR